ncbi:hypothetical protein K501DRAFT_336378 [Backusella circina FSU 941]|nr:hypothetical protein K501DRAFT_336378 [Backusella circina FSU 941]
MCIPNDINLIASNDIGRNEENVLNNCIYILIYLRFNEGCFKYLFRFYPLTRNDKSDFDKLWHRLLTVPSQTKCIYCKTIWRKGPGPAIQPSLFSLSLLRPYSTLLNAGTNTKHDALQPTAVDSRPNKASILADFYRSLATHDMDRIWPIYTFLYNHHLLSTLTRRNYHHLFVYTIHSRPCQKNLHRLSALVEDMKELGFPLKLSEYNALMDWVGGKTVPHVQPHHLTDALQLFEEMQSEELGLAPSVVTFNILIHIAAELADMRTAQKLYHDMISRKLRPDIYTYSTLLFAMGKTGDVHGIDHMLKEIKENGLGHLVNNNIIWNTTMAGYACNGLRDKGYRMFEQMMKALQANVSDNNKKKKKKKKKKKMKGGGIPAADAESFRIYMDMLIYDGKRQDAIQSLDLMKRMGIQPSITIYNTLFGSFLKKPHEWVDDSEIELLKRLYQSMKEIKAKPNSETMYTLVSAFLDLGDTKSALESFVYLSNIIIETKPIKDVQSHSVALLARERFRMIKDPTRIEPSKELLDRLNQVVSDSVI